MEPVFSWITAHWEIVAAIIAGWKFTQKLAQLFTRITMSLETHDKFVEQATVTLRDHGERLAKLEGQQERERHF